MIDPPQTFLSVLVFTLLHPDPAWYRRCMDLRRLDAPSNNLLHSILCDTHIYPHILLLHLYSYCDTPALIILNRIHVRVRILTHRLRKLLKRRGDDVDLATLGLAAHLVALEVVAHVNVLGRAGDVDGRVTVARGGAEVVDVRGDERGFVWRVCEREVGECGEVDLWVSAERLGGGRERGEGGTRFVGA